MIAYTKEQMNNFDLPEAFRGTFEGKNCFLAETPSSSTDLLPDLELAIIIMIIIFLFND